MRADDPAVLDILRRAMVARIATLSRSGRPSVTPLYFVWLNGHVWLGTAAWTLAARDARADPRVSILLNVEQEPQDQRIVRMAGRAVVRTDRAAQWVYNWRVALKYVLNPGGIRHQLAHWDLRAHTRRYRAQSAAKGPACVIDVPVERIELLDYQPPAQG